MTEDAKWDQVRESLREARNRDGTHWDEEEIRAAIQEAYQFGLNPGLVLSCKEACASHREFTGKLKSLIAAGKRILAVDDERDFLDLLELNLEKAGYHVRTVWEADKALAVAREFQPNLILLDVVMPGVDGLEILQQIRTEERLKQTPVILLTALAGEMDQGGVARDGVLYLAKPIAIKRLLHCIEAHLKIGAASGS